MAMSTADLHQNVPFSATLGLEMIDPDPAALQLRLPHREAVCRSGGMLHGGALMSLADVAGAVCASLNAPEGSDTATVDSTTHFLRPVPSAAIATATPLHVGRTLSVVSVEIRGEHNDRVLVRVTQTLVVRAR
ncbi:MAG: PaaI family thioesterase, partial [Antricoccus sp.]